MRIAFIGTMSGYPWGGSEILWNQAAKTLVSKGHAIFASVVRWPETPAPIRALRQMGAEVEERRWIQAPLPDRVLAKLTGRGVSHPGWEPSWNKLLNFRPDLVCISHGGTTCGIEWMERCRMAGIPYVSLAQANAESWWPNDEQRPTIAQAYGTALRTYFVSRANKELFERQIATPLPHSEVVWNPFNVSWNAQPEWPETRDEYLLACVGRYEPAAKGQDLLFQVLAMPQWKDRPLRVNLFGAGKWEQSLRLLAQQLGVDAQVQFMGHVANIEEVWRSHHALVLPSRHEGLPLCLVEAMLCGRTAIITDVAGNGEPVEDNHTAFLAASPQVNHLHEAMERAWNMRDLWQSMGQAASHSIRRQIPQDPAADFADRLLRLC